MEEITESLQKIKQNQRLVIKESFHSFWRALLLCKVAVKAKRSEARNEIIFGLRKEH